MDLSALIAPIATDRFLADTFGIRPLHVGGGGAEGEARRSLLRWPDLNALLAVRSHWTAENIKLIMNSRPVAPDHYMEEEAAGDGAGLADPAKVELFLGMGASLVGNSIEQVAPRVRAAASALGRRFGAKANANLYCSFQGVQAFDSHCDTHEVFAVQCEGEKVWRIYENRAEAPVTTPKGEGAQQAIDAFKGGVLMEVAMRPGDLLYIPRGFYHDATATSGDSLHLTFGVLPLTGQAIFQLLQDRTAEEALFRAYLPNHAHDPAGLRRHLESLSERLREMIGSQRFVDEIADRQRARAPADHRANLPARPSLSFYARTGRPAAVERSDAGAVLRHQGGSEEIGPLGEAADWMIGQAGFSVEQAQRRFPWKAEEELIGLVGLLERRGLISPYTPASLKKPAA